MMHKDICGIPHGVKIQKNVKNNYFIRTVIDEGRQVKECHEREIQSTLENPRIRALNDTSGISSELRSLKHDQFVQVKRRQQLRENNQELRQLEIQIKKAYVRKELAEQKEFIDREKEKAFKAKKEDEDKEEAERLRFMKICQERDLQAHIKKAELRNTLQIQMAERTKKKAEHYEEVMKEREEMQKLLKQIEKETQQELEDLERRKQQNKREMREFKDLQESYKQMMLQEKKDQMEEFLEVQRLRDLENQRLLDKKKALLARREALSGKIGHELHIIQNEKERREELLLNLLVEERKTKDDLQIKNALQKQIEDRLHVRAELERYISEICVGKKEEFMKEEEQFRVQIAKDVEERVRMDQIADEKRRQKRIEHGHAIMDMIEQKRLQRMAEGIEQMQDHEYRVNEERKLQQEIEEERFRLLSLQPSEILKYMPKSVLSEVEFDRLHNKDENK